MNLVEQVQFAIAEAEAGRSKLPPGVLAIDGMSSPKVRHFLNNVTAFSGCRYLEIGCWKGSTLVSALYGKTIDYWAIDNFCDYGSPKPTFESNFSQFIGGRANLFDVDCFTLDGPMQGITNVNVYLYDGWHSQDAQRQALTHFIDSMAKDFIFIVDDWNGPEGAPVRAGTQAAVAELDLQVVFEQTMPGTGNDLAQWWNGMWIAVLSKP